MASTAPQGSRPTLESVASRAAVSRQTVSNVLNAPHLVRPDTIERVRAAIEDLGYRPHRAAQALRTRRSRLIGLRLEPIRDGINGAVLDRFLHALTEEAQTANYRIELFVASDDDDEITQYDQMLVAADVDAFVITGTHHGDPRTTWLAERGVPFVTFGRPWGEPGATVDHPWVDVDGAAGTRAATEHLLEAGHTRIAFLGWPTGSGVGDDRRSGWSAAMIAAGTSSDALVDLDHTGTDDVAVGLAATTRLLARSDPPTAVVCSSDSLALGAMTAATAARARPRGDRLRRHPGRHRARPLERRAAGCRSGPTCTRPARPPDGPDSPRRDPRRRTRTTCSSRTSSCAPRRSRPDDRTGPTDD